MTPVLRHAVLALLLGVLVILGANEYFLRTRGASSPEEIGTRYVAAIRQGDAAAVAWLMPEGRIDEAGIRSRVALYRSLPGDVALEVGIFDHSIASYLKTLCVSRQGSVVDEVGAQHQGGRFGSRWRLFFPPAAVRRCP